MGVAMYPIVCITYSMLQVGIPWLLGSQYEFLKGRAHRSVEPAHVPLCSRQAERRLTEEVERVANYLDPSTEAKLTRVAEQELIHNQACGLAGRGSHV